MAQQARTRPSWKNKTSRKAVKRAKELLRRLFNKRILEIVERHSTGSTATYEGQAREINPNEYYLRLK
jgi:O6-methylguanine-DNA--protein-cysteine methyltransferase